MAADSIFLNLAYVALLSSTFTRTVSRLRVMLVAGAALFVAFGLAIDNTAMVVWNILIGGLHLARLIKDERSQRRVTLTRGEALHRDAYFPTLSDFDFNLLWHMGAPVEYCNEAVLARGERPQMVSLILEGQAEIWSDGEVVRTVGVGGLLGEMSFVSPGPSAVNVRSAERLVTREWRQRDLASLDQLRPSVARALNAYISRDLAAKARLT